MDTLDNLRIPLEDKPITRKCNRLERNRESARKSRRRKKNYSEFLEQKANQLQSEVIRLKQLVQNQKLESHENNVSAIIHSQQSVENSVEQYIQRSHIRHQQRTQILNQITNEAIDVTIPLFTKVLLNTTEKNVVPMVSPFQNVQLQQIRKSLYTEMRKIRENLSDLEELKTEMLELSEWASRIYESLKNIFPIEVLADIILDLEKLNS